MPTPSPIREWLRAYVLGQLSGPERATVKAHLAVDPACRQERDELAGVVRALGSVKPMDAGAPHGLVGRRSPAEGLPGQHAASLGSPMTQPPRELEDRIVQRVREMPRSTPMAAMRLAFGRRADLLGMAAVIALLFVGAFVVGRISAPTPAGPPTEPVSFAQALRGIDARGVLIAHTWGTEVNLTISGLRDGETYVATFVAADGREVHGGTFIGTGDEALVCKLNAAVLRDQASGVVIEDSAGREVLRADFG